jgi:hypothetical protein
MARRHHRSCPFNIKLLRTTTKPFTDTRFLDALERGVLPNEDVLDSFGSTAFYPLTVLHRCNTFIGLRAQYRLLWHTRSLSTPWY